MIRWIAGVAALALPAAAMAQDSIEDKEILLWHPHPVSPTIVVTGAGGLNPSASDMVQGSTLIGDLDPGFGARIENRLRDEAGIVQFRRSDSRSAHPTSQGVTLRGLGGNASSRALVTLDGVPQADPFGGWIAWSAFDAINLGGIVVTRGGGGGADGPGAIAGTIALYSTMTDGGEASLAYGSRDSLDASASVGKTLGNGQIAIDGRYSRGDGFIPIVEGQRGAVDRAASYEQGGIGARMRFDAGDDSRIEASLRGFADRRDRGFDFSGSRIDGVDASLRFVHDPQDQTQWLALAYVQLRDFETGFASVEDDRNSLAPALYQKVPATGLGARVELRPELDQSNPLRLGIDWRRTVGSTDEQSRFNGLIPSRQRSAGGSSDVVGAFVEWTSGDADQGLLWTASGRIDRWWIGEGYRFERDIGADFRSNERFAARQGWEPSGRVGMRWTSDAIALRTAAYSNWRLPTLNELYRPFRVGPDATAANELLQPERLWGGEVGAEFALGGAKVGVTLFANRLENAVANVTLDAGPGLFPGVGFVPAGATYSQRQNLDAIDSKGVELSAEAPVGPLSLRATYAYTDARVEASGVAASLDGRRPAQIAEHGGSVSLATRNEGPFGGFATLRYIGEQNEDDVGLEVLDDALTIDAGLSWRASQALSIEARGENLFDALVPASISGSGVVERAAPRTLWLGARLSF